MTAQASRAEVPPDAKALVEAILERARQAREAATIMMPAEAKANFELIAANASRLAELLEERDAEREELAGAADAQEELIKLCQSYASNTSGGMDAEARLRRIYEMCCRRARAKEAPNG